MKTDNWLIYGAYGYTGDLIAREAVRRGLRPTLAGRRAGPLEALSQELDLPYRSFHLADEETLDATLSGVTAVLHCAGPFVHTSRPMVEACLRTGCHYLDITGEIGVFEAVFQRNDRAREAGVVLMPGTGLDVVPTDCLAAHLHEQLPDATHLELALTSDRGTASRGTLTTMVEGIPYLGAERVDGKIVQRPPAFDAREIEFSFAKRWTMTIPWGDLSTAFRTTGIPNIRVYMGASPGQIKRLRRITPLLPVLGTKPIKKILRWWIRQGAAGPPEHIRESAHAYFWGQVRNGSDQIRSAILETPEGYKLTAMTAVECVTRVLQGEVEPGAWTPAGAFGSEFIKSFAGVSASW